MASSPSPSSCALISSRPVLTQIHTSSLNFISLFKSKNPIKIPQLRRRVNLQRTSSAVKSEIDNRLFERDLGGGDSPPEVPGTGFPSIEEESRCPPGLRKYETMVVLMPDMPENERISFTQKYEEFLVAGGGMYVEVFNRGVIPMAYSIKTRNRAGEANNYLDGIYLMFTYFTRPESMKILVETLLADDNVIRSSSLKVRKRKMF